MKTRFSVWVEVYVTFQRLVFLLIRILLDVCAFVPVMFSPQLIVSFFKNETAVLFSMVFDSDHIDVCLSGVE